MSSGDRWTVVPSLCAKVSDFTSGSLRVEGPKCQGVRYLTSVVMAAISTMSFWMWQPLAAKDFWRSSRMVGP